MTKRTHHPRRGGENPVARLNREIGNLRGQLQEARSGAQRQVQAMAVQAMRSGAVLGAHRTALALAVSTLKATPRDEELELASAIVAHVRQAPATPVPERLVEAARGMSWTDPETSAELGGDYLGRKSHALMAAELALEDVYPRQLLERVQLLERLVAILQASLAELPHLPELVQLVNGEELEEEALERLPHLVAAHVPEGQEATGREPVARVSAEAMAQLWRALGAVIAFEVRVTKDTGAQALELVKATGSAS